MPTIDHDRRRLVGAAATVIALTGFSLVWPVSAEVAPLPIEGKLPPFDGAAAWLNSAPLVAADLRGKVVLISFWNFTCINWLRQRPYVRAWAEKYKDPGLVVIGVHAPEFAFEKSVDSVRRDITGARVDYPIVVDNDHAIWRAFNNQYWPALYFVDVQGRIRHHQFGEGDYDESEKHSAAAGRRRTQRERFRFVSPDPQGIEVQADWPRLKSPETYVGYARGENFASPGGIREDIPNLYRATSSLTLNRWISPACGPLAANTPQRTKRPAASRTASVPATSTSSWHHRCPAPQFAFGLHSTGRHPALTTASMWARTEREPYRMVASISSSGKRALLPTGRSRSSS